MPSGVFGRVCVLRSVSPRSNITLKRDTPCRGIARSRVSSRVARRSDFIIGAPLNSHVRNHMRMTQDEIDDQKKIEFYAASVAAWYESSLEHDKSLLTLSAGGIGLLITLLTTVGLGTSEALVLYIGAICSFVVSLVSILFVFRGNQRHIEDILSGKNQGADPILSKLDGTAIWSFGIGVVFTCHCRM